MKAILIFALCFSSVITSVTVKPAFFTEPVSTDADDPAIWVHPTDPAKSLVFGTDKTRGTGGIYAFNLEGKTVQHVEGLDRPNNCDVEYGFKGMDILVATERLQHRLRIFSIDRATGVLSDVSGKTAVFEGQPAKHDEPMGIALYKNPKNSGIDAIVSRSSGPADGYLGRYKLVWNETTKKIDALHVRNFGKFSGKKEIESVSVDDELGFVYYSDETVGTRRYRLDTLDKEDLFFNTSGFKGDHEGIAIYETGKESGFVICTDQIAGDSVYHVYNRVKAKEIGTFTAGIDDTDGIEVVSSNLGPKFPKGAFVAMNSKDRNFAVVDWREIAAGLKLPATR